MNYKYIIKLLLLISIITLICQLSIVSGQDDAGSFSSSEEEWKDDKTFCQGKTFETCITSGACCVWCSNETVTFDEKTQALVLGNDTTTAFQCIYDRLSTSCPVYNNETEVVKLNPICPTNMTYTFSGCNCNIITKSDASSIFKPTYLTPILLSTLSILFLMKKNE